MINSCFIVVAKEISWHVHDKSSLNNITGFIMPRISIIFLFLYLLDRFTFSSDPQVQVAGNEQKKQRISILSPLYVSTSKKRPQRDLFLPHLYICATKLIVKVTKCRHRLFNHHRSLLRNRLLVWNR